MKIDVKEKLIEISVKLDEVKEDLKAIKELDQRIEVLEDFNSRVKGAGLILAAIGTIGLGLLTSVLNKFF